MSTMLRGLFSHSLYKHVHKAAHVFIEMLKKSFFYKKKLLCCSHTIFIEMLKKWGCCHTIFIDMLKKIFFLYKNVHEDAVGFL